MSAEIVEPTANGYFSPWDEYRQHPGQVALGKWKDIQDFYVGIVLANEASLMQYLKAPIVNQKIRQQLLASVGQSQYGIEAARRLCNYLSSITSLVDHTRNILRNYDGSDFESMYKERVQSVKGLGESTFLKDLRNYTVHYRLPPIGYIVSSTKIFDRNEPFIPLIYSGDLSDYHGWSKSSKQYMQDHFPEIELIPLVDTYAQSINDLYSWMFDQFDAIHGDDVAESERIKLRILNGKSESP